jgi:hypothetical protein
VAVAQPALEQLELTPEVLQVAARGFQTAFLARRWRGDSDFGDHGI